MSHEHDENEHGGLAQDLRALAATKDRRQALRLLAGASLVSLWACATSGAADDGGVTAPDATSTDADGAAGTEGSAPTSCAQVPEETGGPYPGDGSNGANALALTGIVRSDIRTSLAPATGTAAGVPLTVKLTLANINAGCAPLAGYAVYIWHCDRDGNYSMYTLATENYLRGVQEADASGTVTFTTIFPGCYSGRWPHIHFEIYSSVAKAQAASGKVKTSQLALPADICRLVYATSGYEASVRNLAQTSLASDMVFSDGATLETPLVTGTVTQGFVASLTVGVPA